MPVKPNQNEFENLTLEEISVFLLDRASSLPRQLCWQLGDRLSTLCLKLAREEETR